MPNYHIDDRPSTFEDYIGHEDIVLNLKYLLDSGFPRGVIFHGNSGTGKTTLAYIIANLLAERDNIKKRSVSDYEVKTGSVATALSEELEIITKPLWHLKEGKKPNTVLIIDECQRFSPQAQQNLLTTIENKDYPHLYFIGCTTELKKLNSALKNRCSLFHTTDHPVECIVKAMKQSLERGGISFDIKDLYLIAESARGSIRDALTTVTSYLRNDEVVISDKRALLSIDVSDEGYIPKTDEDKLFLLIAYGIYESNLPRVTYMLSLITSLFKEGKSAQTVVDQFKARILLLHDMSTSKVKNKTSLRIESGNLNTISYLSKLLECLEPCDTFTLLSTRLFQFHEKCMGKQ